MGLGLVHRRVSVAHHGVDVLHAVGQDRDADRIRNMQLGAADAMDLAQARHQPLVDDGCDLGAVGHAVEQGDKLVAAEPADGAADAHRLGQAPPH